MYKHEINPNSILIYGSEMSEDLLRIKGGKKTEITIDGILIKGHVFSANAARQLEL